jgi:galactokinase
MMFASNDMDGKFKLISPQALVRQEQGSANQIVNTPTTPVAEEHFVETECGIADCSSFRVGQLDYILAGFEDGSLHLYNMSSGFGKSF